MDDRDVAAFTPIFILDASCRKRSQSTFCFYRDGAAIEIVGLCKAIVTWLAKINKEKHYEHRGVQLNSTSPTERFV